MIHYLKECDANGDRIAVTKIGLKVYLSKIKEMVSANKFEIINRKKNIEFRKKYVLIREKIKTMILKLETEDIVDIVNDIDYLNYGKEKLLIFIKEYILVDIYGKDKKVKVYIKIKLKDNFLPIISFHESM